MEELTEAWQFHEGRVPALGRRRAGVLLGTEGEDLPAAVIAGSTPVGIAMAPGVDSLNVAVTTGIALHHLKFAQAWTSPPSEERRRRPAARSAQQTRPTATAAAVWNSEL